MTPAPFQVQKAVREQLRLRVALIGPSGSGKTYSALTLATGIGGSVCLLDTEDGRGKIYADEFDYGYVPLENPRSPERYCEAIKAIAEQGITTLIIDGMYHEWQFLLDSLDLIRDVKNDFAKWGKLTPRHNGFLKTIDESDLHIIACMRGKDQYMLEEKNNKQVPKKIGMGPQFRDGFEYGTHVAFILDVEGNSARQMKDNTHAFETINRRITVDDGRTLAKWAGGGVVAAPRPAAQNVEAPAESVEERYSRLDHLATTIIAGMDGCRNADELARFWAKEQVSIKLLDGIHEQRVVNAKEICKKRFLAPPAAPPDDGKGIFDQQGKVRPEIPPETPAQDPVVVGEAAEGPVDHRTMEQRTTEGNYVNFIRSARLRKTLDGLAEAIESEQLAGKLTAGQSVKLAVLIAEKEREIDAALKAKRKSAVAA